MPPALAAQLPASFVHSQDDQVSKVINRDPDLVETLIALAAAAPDTVVEFTVEFKDHTTGQFRISLPEPSAAQKPTSMKLAWTGVAFKRVNGSDVRILRNGDPLFQPEG